MEDIDILHKIYKELVELFEIKEEQVNWLNTPNKAFDNKKPIQLIQKGKPEVVLNTLKLLNQDTKK